MAPSPFSNQVAPSSHSSPQGRAAPDRLKILHLTGEREDMGGILSVIRNLQSNLQPTHCAFAVWVNRAFVETRKPQLSFRRSQYLWSDHPNHFYILSQSLRAFFELKNLLAQEPFDLIHAHTRGTFFVALLWARLRQSPVLFTNHSYARRTGLYHWAARRPNFATVVLTPNMARHYRLQAAPPKVNIISACCADDFFHMPLVERRRAKQQKPIRLVGIGNIMRWKNWHLLAQALTRLSPEERAQFSFTLWGPTPGDPDSQTYDPELRASIGQLGLEDQFQLRGPAPSIRDCLQQADWFVLPSTNEPCSVALIEALALGIPALVSDSGGNGDIVLAERTGLLFRPDDADDLARQLQRILRADVNPAAPGELRNSVKHRSALAVSAQYLLTYHALKTQFF